MQKHFDECAAEQEFRQKLVAARKEAGLTQKELGARSGLDQRTISRMESSKTSSPCLRMLVKYLNAIGYRLEVVKATVEY